MAEAGFFITFFPDFWTTFPVDELDALFTPTLTQVLITFMDFIGVDGHLLLLTGLGVWTFLGDATLLDSFGVFSGEKN